MIGREKMAFLRFEDLRVFQLAEKLCDDIWSIVISWEYFEKNTVGMQLVKSADSVGANIAEGAGRGTHRENKRFVRISRGSLNETKYWIRRARRRSLITDQQNIFLR
jgi:four helix bundle protein